jgi:hypothetical protein
MVYSLNINLDLEKVIRQNKRYLKTTIDKEITCGLFLDFSKAFDTVNHQWRAGYYFSGGASGLSTNMRPYNVTRAEGTSRAPQVGVRVSEMPFPGLWGTI